MTKASTPLIISTSQAMETLGAQVARTLTAPCIVYLRGDLGAGKTTLVRGALRELGHQGHVKSPTFTLVESYSLANLEIHHFDLYRVTDPAELDYIGISEYLHSHSICWFEWPDLGAHMVPKANLEITIHYHDQGRSCIVEGVDSSAWETPDRNC